MCHESIFLISQRGLTLVSRYNQRSLLLLSSSVKESPESILVILELKAVEKPSTLAASFTEYLDPNATNVIIPETLFALYLLVM